MLWGELGEGRQARGGGHRSGLPPPAAPNAAEGGWELGWGLRLPGAACPERGAAGAPAASGARLRQRGCGWGCAGLCRPAVGEVLCPHAVMSCQVSAPGTSGPVHPSNTAPSTPPLPRHSVSSARSYPPPSQRPHPFFFFSFAAKTLAAVPCLPALSPSPPSPRAAGWEPLGWFWHAMAPEEA